MYKANTARDYNSPLQPFVSLAAVWWPVWRLWWWRLPIVTAQHASWWQAFPFLHLQIKSSTLCCLPPQLSYWTNITVELSLKFILAWLHSSSVCWKPLLATTKEENKVRRSSRPVTGSLLEPVLAGTVPCLSTRRNLWQGFGGIREAGALFNWLRPEKGNVCL